MYRFIRKSGSLYCFVPSVLAGSSYDYPDDRRLYDVKGETGMERLYLMYTRDKYGTYSKEIVSAIQISFGSAVLGFIFGGLRDSKGAALEYIERNDVTTYISHWEAKRKAQDYVITKFMFHGFKWAAKLAAFSFVSTLLIETIEVYKGRTGISDFAIAGAITGGLTKCFLGIKGLISGAAVGGFVGLFFGSLIVAALKYDNKTMDEVREWQAELRRKREKAQGDGRLPKAGMGAVEAISSRMLHFREIALGYPELPEKEVVYIKLIKDPSETSNKEEKPIKSEVTELILTENESNSKKSTTAATQPVSASASDAISN